MDAITSDAIATTPEELPLPEPFSQRKPQFRFTRDNAKQFSAKANQARWSRAKQPKLPEAQAEQVPASPDDGYVQTTVSRTRRQLDRLFELMEEELDPQKLDRLASAIARLAEQERQLSGRPLPGSLRPKQKRTKRSNSSAEPEA